jgi:1,4-dihydroxy-2-naphthoate polyprenyltransferase
MNINVWLRAFRLRTLPLALSCVGMGTFLAARAGFFRWSIFLLCILTTVFLQILSNLSNDYGDSIHGADSDDRKGPSRTVQSGAIAAGTMRAAMAVFALLSFSSGLLLLFTAFGMDWKAILFFLVLGLLSIMAAIAYTVGRKPYGYAGLGDISVFVFFGLVGVLGSFYLFARHVTWLEVFPAITLGLFSVAVLNINNIRDISSDQKAGKQSVPVRLGRDRAVKYHWFLLIGGLTAAVMYVVLTSDSAWQWLFLITVPLFIKNGLTVSRLHAEQLDPYLKQMALSTLLFVILYGTGQLLR